MFLILKIFGTERRGKAVKGLLMIAIVFVGMVVYPAGLVVY
jgi:hypothetical protein